MKLDALHKEVIAKRVTSLLTKPAAQREAERRANAENVRAASDALVALAKLGLLGRLSLRNLSETSALHVGFVSVEAREAIHIPPGATIPFPEDNSSVLLGFRKDLSQFWAAGLIEFIVDTE